MTSKREALRWSAACFVCLFGALGCADESQDAARDVGANAPCDRGWTWAPRAL